MSLNRRQKLSCATYLERLRLDLEISVLYFLMRKAAKVEQFPKPGEIRLA